MRLRLLLLLLPMAGFAASLAAQDDTEKRSPTLQELEKVRELEEGGDLEKAEAENRQASDEELEQARDQHKALGAQLDELERLYEKSQDHLNLKTERLRDVTSLGLTMAGLPSLTPRSL